MEEIHRRIPHRPPFLFIDEIIDISKEGAEASLTVRPDFPFFEGHYPGNPIMPGVLLCESVFQTGAVFLADLLGEETLVDETATPFCPASGMPVSKEWFCPATRSTYPSHLETGWGNFST